MLAFEMLLLDIVHSVAYFDLHHCVQSAVYITFLHVTATYDFACIHHFCHRQS